jgi:hypothetical protein
MFLLAGYEGHGHLNTPSEPAATTSVERSGTWLLLYDENDLDALWLAEGLKARGLLGLQAVTTKTLMASRPWVYRLGPSGVEAALTVDEGPRIVSSNVEGVINRVAALPMDRFDRLPETDQAYAEQEFVAFFLAWLEAFPLVINRPAPGGLCGPWRTLTEWNVLAYRAGLPTRPRVVTTEQPQGSDLHPEAAEASALVVGAEVICEPPVNHLVDACRALAALAGTTMLQIDMTIDPKGAASFSQASPLPRLTWAGAKALDAVCQLLLR